MNQKASNTEESRFAGNKWITQGLIWGAFMFVILELLLPFARKEEVNQSGLLLGAIIWIIGGLLFGYTMKQVTKRSAK